MSSGATSPARAPASIDMLHTVMRPSIESDADRRAAVLDDRADAAAGADAGDDREDDVLGGDAGAAASPSTVIAIVPGFACGSVCVASTCSTSLVPMPNASAPNAPCVEVWLSPHTIVMPGLGEALLGTDDVHDALARVAHRVAAGCRTRRSSGASTSICLRGDRVLDRAVEARGRARCGPSSRR